MINDRIDKELFKKYGVKEGLRDENGQGVVTGLSTISDVSSFDYIDGKRVARDGRLLYRGIDIKDIIQGNKGKRFLYEETAYLLLFGVLPTRQELEDFKEALAESMVFPITFTRDVIMKATTEDIMTSMTKSMLTLASYDEEKNNLDPGNVLRQCIELIRKLSENVKTRYEIYRA